MLDEKGGGDHADAVVHVAGLPEFAHAGIDDGIAGKPFFPALKDIRSRLAPRKTVELGLKIPAGQIRKVKPQVMAELPPCQFRQEFAGIPVADIPAVLALAHGMPELAWRNHAEAQIGREPGNVTASGKVSALAITLRALCQKVIEKLPCACLAGRPQRFPAISPVGAVRLQAERIEFTGARHLAAKALQRLWRGKGWMRLALALQRIPEWREHLVWAAAAGQKTAGLM